ncbi:MAG: ATP-binding protein [Candidatus Glassbacteria bacterium]|nr:ATP-binding protein [Candidatus Glassbacteria bacterium]
MSVSDSRTYTFDRVERMSIPAEYNRELEVADRAVELALSVGLDAIEADEVRLAVIEAVINAIEHGRSDEGRVHVSFSTASRPARLAVTVGDSGGGFDPADVKIPDIAEKIGTSQRKRGWGLKLMRSLMDEVVIDSSEQGTRVTLIKQSKKAPRD